VIIEEIVRYLVLAAFAFACLIALTWWALREGKLAPSNPLAKIMRQAGDPFVQPMARRVARMGGNPQDAPFWLLAAVVLGGLLVITATGWLLDTVAYIEYASRNGPRVWFRLLIDLAYFLLVAALVVRVAASWLGLSRQGRMVGAAYRLTDWIVLPIRRLLPAMGPFDLSPIVAWLFLMIVRVLLHAIIPAP
jgi:YggT family protein